MNKNNYLILFDYHYPFRLFTESISLLRNHGYQNIVCRTTHPPALEKLTWDYLILPDQFLWMRSTSTFDKTISSDADLLTWGTNIWVLSKMSRSFWTVQNATSPIPYRKAIIPARHITELGHTVCLYGDDWVHFSALREVYSRFQNRQPLPLARSTQSSLALLDTEISENPDIEWALQQQQIHGGELACHQSLLVLLKQAGVIP